MSTLTGLISSGGGGINSVQRGTVTGTSTVTISSVDVNKTFVNVSFTSTGSTSQTGSGRAGIYDTEVGFGFGKAGGRAVLTNATTLNVTATDSSTTTYYEVVEYA
jgi:hypothetical protein